MKGLEGLADAIAALAEDERSALDIGSLPPEQRAVGVAVNALLARRAGERAALMRFVGDAAHQLRTPLAVLAARLQAPGAVDVERARGDVDWIGRLVEQLLTSARASTPDPGAQRPLDLAALGREIVAALAPLAIYRGRDLAFATAPGDAADRTVTADRTLVFEALSNLVENALSHAPEGSTVEVRAGPGRSLHVLDRGPGVPEAERTRIFERFAQGSRPTANGAGLGLSIVADAMAHHGGEAVYEPREGGGARFSLLFPGTAD